MSRAVYLKGQRIGQSNGRTDDVDQQKQKCKQGGGLKEGEWDRGDVANIHDKVTFHHKACMESGQRSHYTLV